MRRIVAVTFHLTQLLDQHLLRYIRNRGLQLVAAQHISARSCRSEAHLPRQTRFPSRPTEIAVSFSETPRSIYSSMAVLRQMRGPGFLSRARTSILSGNSHHPYSTSSIRVTAPAVTRDRSVTQAGDS